MSQITFPFPTDAVEAIAARDGSLFADDAAGAAEASRYMGWTDLGERTDEVLPAIEALAAEVKGDGLTDVVLLGMGGSSLAALVMGHLLPGDGTRLHVLDTTSPASVASTLEMVDIASTLFLVSSKSGGTVEPNALYAICRAQADAVLGRGEAGMRFVAITDPGSSLERLAAEDGMRAVVLAPPSVGGRYSALTAFGLVPAALLGADVRRFAMHARSAEDRIRESGEPPALAHLMAAGHQAGRDKLTIVAPERLQVFGLWVEQLVAESLGKDGRGVVPVVEGALDHPREVRPDEVIVTIGSTGDEDGGLVPVGDAPRVDLVLDDPYALGAWFVEWEWAVALAGVALRVNAFVQPNVAEAKAATNAVLDGSLSAPEPDADDAGTAITSAGGLSHADAPESGVLGALTHGLDSLRAGDYLAVLAFLPDDPDAFDPVRMATAALGASRHAAACFELGPRYLHSTGQLHKGGPNSGVFIVLTTRDDRDLEIPGWPFSLGRLHRAQAEGDLVTLAAHGRRVLRLDLPDARPETLAALAEVMNAAAVPGAR